ncbi:zinc-dependent metalloprotease [Phytomonospora sp. NPDC050363]|uniref:zinc-dependent metalloprotease n=1 Tax=Phytomonospora sp. NPDC050363 TaxID=3155642 RepID=UPI00340C86EB
MTQFVDWELAARTARALGKTGPAVTFEEAASVVSDLRRLAEEAAGHVAAFTGMEARPSPVRVVDRPDWAQANIDGLRQVLGPLGSKLTGSNGEPGPVARAIGTRVTAVQAGTVLAYLSGKVLGQYEIFGEESGQLLLIAPNILDTERKLKADPHDFRLWVCLHEVTHRTQFTAVPWLRDHFMSEIDAFAEAGNTDAEAFAERARRAMSTIAEAARDPEGRTSVIDAVTTDDQREVIARITALMTLLEGHAEFVMDGVGPEVIGTVAEIRQNFNKRRGGGNPLERVVRKLLGVDVKLRQYAEGRAFVEAAVEQVGMATFNRVWTSPETLPTLDELSDPSAWVARVCT